jgi:signal transduction histidine kinase
MVIYNRHSTTEPVTIDSIRLSAKRNKLVAITLSAVVLAIAGGWVWIDTHQFYEQMIRKNQEHLLDMAKAEARFLKHLYLTKEDYSKVASAHDITIGERGYLWIIDVNGILLSHPKSEQIGHAKLAIRKAAFPDYDWSELERVVQRMRNGEEGVGIYQSIWWTEKKPEASRKLVGFTPVQMGNRLWFVAACMPLAEIAKPMRYHVLRDLATAGLAVLLCTITGRTFYMSQKRENRALRREATEHKNTKEALQKAHDTLEQRVEERTTELKRTNELLRQESEERRLAEQRSRELAKFPGENPSPVLRISENGTVIYANRAGDCLLRYLGTELNRPLPTEWCRIVEDAISAGSNKQQEVEYRGHTFSLIFAPIVSSGYVNIYGLDITERKRLEQQILRINDRVQANIGRDLHDGLLQQLTGVALFCDTLVERLTEISSPCTDDAREISEHLRQLMTWLRDLAKGLYPADLDSNGLAPALETLASTATYLFKVSVVFKFSELINISNPQVALHLYRIAQEAVNNAIKHGNAKHICISLARSKDTITLTVRDNGSGFSQEETARGLGLQSMHFRAKAIGGILYIQSGDDEGTVVSCSFSERSNV